MLVINDKSSKIELIYGDNDCLSATQKPVIINTTSPIFERTLCHGVQITPRNNAFAIVSLRGQLTNIKISWEKADEIIKSKPLGSFTGCVVGGVRRAMTGDPVNVLLCGVRQ